MREPGGGGASVWAQWARDGNVLGAEVWEGAFNGKGDTSGTA
jgi:hypothetical protein